MLLGALSYGLIVDPNDQRFDNKATGIRDGGPDLAIVSLPPENETGLEKKINEFVEEFGPPPRRCLVFTRVPLPLWHCRRPIQQRLRTGISCHCSAAGPISVHYSAA